MTATLIDGTALSKTLRNDVAARAAAFVALGRRLRNGAQNGDYTAEPKSDT